MIVEIIGADGHFKLMLQSRVTSIVGDSATGKTSTLLELAKSRTQVHSALPLYILSSASIPVLNGYSNCCLLLDLDTLDNPYLVDLLVKLDVVEKNIYIVLFGRRYLNRFPLSIYSVCIYETENNVTRNVYCFSQEPKRLTKPVNLVTVEDSGSGYNFFKGITDSVVSLHGCKNFRNITDYNTVCFIDALGFGAYVREFMRLYAGTELQYILWDSFEAFLLKAVFNEVCNTDGINREEIVENTYRERTRGVYSKSKGCCDEYCGKCPNSCKTKSIDALLSVYPELQGYFSKGDLLSVYLMRCPDVKAEYKRLQSLAEASGCSIEEIIEDLM